MILPPDVAGLTGWWKQEYNESVAGGGALATWRSQTGPTANFAQATGANQPAWSLNQVNGLPAVNFDGTDDFMDGPDMDDLLGVGQGVIFVAFYTGDVTTRQCIITDTTGASGRVFLTINAGTLIARNNDGASQEITRPLTVGWHVAIWLHTGGNLRLYVDDPLEFSSVASGNTAALSPTRIGENSSNIEPFKDLLGEIVTYDTAPSDGDRSAVFAYLTNRWLDRGDPLEQLRDVASRRMVFFQRPRLAAEVTVPLLFLDRDVGDAIGVTHPHIPNATGDGAGLEPWRRRIMTLHSMDEDLDNFSLSLGLRDRQAQIHNYLESGIAIRTVDSRREGVMISAGGAVRVHTRESKAYVELPGRTNTTSQAVVEVPGGIEAATEDGVYTDPAGECILPRTSFISGTTGLTLTGTGGGNTIAADTAAPLLFETGVTPNSLKITKGAAAALYAQWPASVTISASQKLCFSIDYADQLASGTALRWALQRSTDSQWWNDSGQTWGAGITWNILPLRSLADPVVRIGRTRSNVIAWPASSGTATLRVGYDGATSGYGAFVYHVQLEASGWQTGRMVQDATAAVGDRAAVGLGFFETTGQVFNEPRGTLGFVLKTPFSVADLEVGSATVPGGWVLVLWAEQYLNPSTAHYWRGGFDASLGAGNSRWHFSVKNASTEVIAFNTSTLPVRDGTYAVVWRWTSAADGELGLPANTIDVFVNGVKGTSAAIVTRPTVISNSRFQMNLFGARMRRFFSTARVWTDKEILAWSSS